MNMDALIIPELQALSHKLAEPELCFGVPAVYLACTLGGYAIMRPVKKAFVIPDWFKLVYNVFQVHMMGRPTRRVCHRECSERNVRRGRGLRVHLESRFGWTS